MTMISLIPHLILDNDDDDYDRGGGGNGGGVYCAVLVAFTILVSGGANPFPRTIQYLTPNREFRDTRSPSSYIPRKPPPSLLCRISRFRVNNTRRL